VRFLQWQVDTSLPAQLAGLRLGLSANDRWTDLVRLSVGSSTNSLLPVALAGDQGYTLSSDSTILRHGASKGTLDLMFASPLTVAAYSYFRLELTHGQSNGPRLGEVDALLIYPVPEPSAVVLLGVAGAALALVRRRGRRR
jgi:hypothetical protein